MHAVFVDLDFPGGIYRTDGPPFCMVPVIRFALGFVVLPVPGPHLTGCMCRTYGLLGR